MLKFPGPFFLNSSAKEKKVNSTVGSAAKKSHMMIINTKIVYARIA